MAIEEKQSELSWEEAVGRFLQENPAFFERNPHLLKHLDIPHAQTGRAVSLIERQVQSLRRENETLDNQLHQLVDNATENDALAGQLHRFIVDLMQVADVEQLIELATDGLKSRFNLDLVALKLFSTAKNQPASEIYVDADNPVVRQITDQVREGQSVSGVRFSPEESNLLFAQDDTPEGSLALIPVTHDRLTGLLIIGSNDPARFNPDMATTYLDRVGELIAVALLRLSASQPGSK